ncbi:MAG: agmatine deiminase family protein [Thermoanaerobaculia bacterium]|nr:agmatine deiminase family protein [Thermoanaerobaculia bacterium]
MRRRGRLPVRLPDPAFLATIADDDPVRLRRGFDAGERPVAPPPFLLAPPAGAVHTRPEYARNRGLLIRWGSFNQELTAIAVAVTTGDPEARVFVVVSGSSQQASAASILGTAGADLARIEFLTAPTNSVWIRDYGPRFIEEDGAAAIVDHVYNRPRPQDDLVPVAVANAWSLARYDLPLVHGGGNFHLLGDGEAFMTELVLDENPGLSEQDVVDLYAAYQNLDLTIWPGFPTSYDSTRHIDMWLLPVRDRVAIVGQYPPGDGAPHTITENAVTELLSRGYTVLRTPGWNPGFPDDTHYTYTNAVVLNDVVLVPAYTAYPLENQQAAAVFAQAFPGRQIVPIDADALVGLAGVFHCIVMHVPDPEFLFQDDFETGDLTVWSTSAP